MTKTTLKRVNSPLPSLLGNTKVKQSRAFIEDIRSNNEFISNVFIKLTSTDAFRLYENNPWVNACINTISDDCVKIKPVVVPKDPTVRIKEATKRRMEIVTRFLERPNNNKETFSQIRKKLIKDLQIFGRAAIEKRVSNEEVTDRGTRQVLEIFNLQAANMRINADKNGNLSELNTYILRTGNINNGQANEPVFFDKDEVIFIVREPYVGSLYGTKQLDTLANDVASDLLRAAYNTNFFVNGSETSGVITIEGASKREIKQFEEHWRCKYNGVNNSHRIAVSNKPIEFVRMALTNRDMQFQEYGLELRGKIFAVFGMQPIILGLDDQSGRQINGKSEAVRCYKENALKPILNLESDAYTKEIVEDGFGFFDIRISFDSIDSLDKITQSEIDKRDLESLVVTINEVRGSRGQQPVPWGDTPVTVTPGGGQIDPNTGMLIPPRQQGNNNQTNTDNSDESKNITRMDFNKCKGVGELNNYFLLINFYTKYLLKNNIDIDADNVDYLYSHLGSFYFEKYFNNIHENAICRNLLDNVKKFFISKNLRNYENFLIYYDIIIKDIKKTNIYRDLEDYGNNIKNN